MDSSSLSLTLTVTNSQVTSGSTQVACGFGLQKSDHSKKTPYTDMPANKKSALMIPELHNKM